MGTFIDKIRPYADRIKSFIDLSGTSIREQYDLMLSKIKHTGVSDAETAVNSDKKPGTAISGARAFLAKPRKKVKPIKRHGRQKVYRLKGYTTVAKINRKRQSERQQRLLRRLLIGIIIVLAVILFFNIYNPIRDLSEWYRIIGIKDLGDLADSMEATTTVIPSSETTAIKTTAATAKAP